MAREASFTPFTAIGVALREPEEFAASWHRDEISYRPIIWLALGLTAAAGTLIYGLTMGIGQGAGVVLYKSLAFTFAAGLAWAIPLPALYILNSLSGSRLRPGTTLLAALVTTSWGGLAMIASVPINWLFSTAVPDLPFLTPTMARNVVLAVNAIIFTGVGVSMIDVFTRVLHRLEPRRDGEPTWYLALVGLIGLQLFYLFDLFQF